MLITHNHLDKKLNSIEFELILDNHQKRISPPHLHLIYI